MESKYLVVSKMMAAMGYRPDRGLGKETHGIVAPMEGTLHPGHAELDSVKEPKPLFSGRENLAPALAQKELGQPRWSKKAGKRKDPVLMKNALLAEDERPMGVQKVIDMGGLQVRVLTDLTGLNDRQDMEVDDDMPMPELQQNLLVLVDMPWTDIRRLDVHLKSGNYPPAKNTFCTPVFAHFVSRDLIIVFFNTVQSKSRTYIHPTPMSTSERLSRHSILRFYEVTTGAS